jgi:hypothetical protein
MNRSIVILLSLQLLSFGILLLVPKSGVTGKAAAAHTGSAAHTSHHAPVVKAGSTH